MGEPEVLARLQALRAKGLAFGRLATAANEEGLPTRTGGRWFGGAVNRILICK